MLTELKDNEQELILFLIDLLKNIDLSKFPANDTYTLKSYICVALRNKYIALSKEYQKEIQNRFEVKDEIDDILEVVFSRFIGANDYRLKIIELKEALNLLSEKQKDVIVYKYVYLFSDAEIGERLNISRQAVNRLKNRALKILKEYYKEGVNSE